MNDRRQDIYKLIEKKRITEAIELLREVLTAEQPSLLPRLDRSADVYRHMLEFFVSGAPDPDRDRILANLRLQLLELCDELHRSIAIVSDSAQYYETVRIRKGFSDESLSGLFSLLQDNSRQPAQYEELLKTIFFRIWTAYGLTPEEQDAIIAAPTSLKPMLISALGLGLRTWWHTGDVTFLLELIQNPHLEYDNRVRALVELVLVLETYPLHTRLFEPVIKIHLDVAQESFPLGAVLEQLYIRLFRAQHTERLTQELQEELLPAMQKIWSEGKSSGMQQDLERLFEKAASDPEWMRKMRESGIEDKMRRISDLQAEGADVVFGSFRHLKAMPFFSDLHNWFRPFSPEDPQVKALLQQTSALSDAALVLPYMLCDSDIFSLLFTLKLMPQESRSMALAQMGFDMREMQEQINEFKRENKAATGEKLSNTIKRYVENLYRFHKLFSRRASFYDVFAKDFSVPEVLNKYLSPDKTQALFGRKLLSLGRCAAAIPFLRKAVQTEPSRELYEQLGYAYQLSGNPSRALKAYNRADILSESEPGSWLLKQMAFCAGAMGRTEKAVELYLQLATQEGGDKRACLVAAALLMEQKQYPRAIELYLQYRDLTGREDLQMLRPLAWCYFSTARYEEARAIYQQICGGGSVLASDELNLGHCYAVASDRVQALEHYRKAVSLYGDHGLRDLIKAYRNDTADLAQAGISPDLQALYVDSMAQLFNE
ncbi:hypothetical protein PORCRE_859 [Porphyromonas crevioricanis JCM 15906]|uniref:Bacterial transcriptional activator domain-containing protein n=1 Tax=Porphyromonas crevioricanis JCM 15906 TaxID=1305617 RepID=T1DS82_9PORP|nr:tetratricopeptide repeat protein [Porphyromonas crevioricanis]GAD05159.1 hypothetical protein PORCRE_859 [Porphyromonas crevioricanis JCM 15906]SJZ84957.1 Tetratricopeptide (TPR) repeat [Porphyromonas crevioricanis]